MRRLFTNSESEDDLWYMRRRSNSPPPPPIAAPLLEMGFSVRHILKAIFETKSSGEVSAHTINMLATWMIEHPSLDTCVEEDNFSAGSSMRRAQELNILRATGPKPPISVGRGTRNLGYLELLRQVYLHFRFSFVIKYFNFIFILLY